MEYHIDKMMLRTLLWLIFLRVLHSYPQNLNLPDLEVSSPEEVNSLEQDEPFGNPSPRPQTIEDTVKEVEEIIRSNPALPRLTRGEILDLLENITTTDGQKAPNRSRDPKAIMVVMPYTPTNDKNMEDLYTKAPVTHIIGAEPFKTKEETIKPKHSRRRPPVKYNDPDLTKKTSSGEEKKKYSATITDKNKPVRRRRPEVTTQISTSTTYATKPTEPTTYRPQTRRPLRRRTTTVPTTQHPNHRYPEEFVRNEGIKIIESPNLAPTESSEDLILDENLKQEVVMKQQLPSTVSLVTEKPTPLSPVFITEKHPPVSSFTEKHSPVSSSFTTEKPKDFEPTRVTKTTMKPLAEEMSLPESLKTLMKDLNVETALNPQEDNLRISLEEQNRIKNMLASIGALPETTTVTTTTLLPNAANVAESLSPDMRELLMSFGLLPDPNPKPVATNTERYYPDSAEVKPESYIGFKPLPDDGQSRQDMDALLASFGLGRSARKEKAMQVQEDKPSYNTDMIPDYLKGIIADMGIPQSSREAKKIEIPAVVEKQHVFNPDSQHASDDELKRLEKLIEMIKQLEKMNGTVSDENLKNIDVDSLKELVSSLNGNSSQAFVTLDQKDLDSPDPNDYDSGVIKNEVKRQENTTTSTTTTTTSTDTSTEESETPSIKDLEESFGGHSEESTESLPETTPGIKTGFYYLVDWNTFLDIDDTKGKRVNLRFQPTIGDPKRFLSVTVP